MNDLNLTTPSLLFSAISLILLAYTNRFLSYAQVVRNLQKEHEKDKTNSPVTLQQIANLVKRLELIRAMQILGTGSLLFCITAMFFLYIQWRYLAEWFFGIGMVLLAISLALCIIEIQISVKALYINLDKLSDGQLFTRFKHRLRFLKQPSDRVDQDLMKK